jgi:hypothetical protein
MCIYCLGHFSTQEFYIYSYRESMTTIFIFLVSFFHPTPPMCDLPLVCPVFHNIAVFILGLYSTYEREQESSLLDIATLGNKFLTHEAWEHTQVIPKIQQCPHKEELALKSAMSRVCHNHLHNNSPQSSLSSHPPTPLTWDMLAMR